MGADTYVRVRKPELRSVRFVDNQYGWIAGTQGVFHTRNGGWSWQRQKVVTAENFGHVTSYLLEPSGKILWADRERALIRADAGLIMCNAKTRRWRLIRSPKLSSFQDIVFLSPGLGWGATRREICVTRDGGNSWELKTGTSSEDFTSISAISAKIIWAVGHQSLLMYTVDGGETWRRAFLPNDKPYSLHCVKFVDQKRGFVFGIQGALFSSDGGVSWTKEHGLDMSVTMLFGVAFLDERNGVIVGDGTIFHTDNAGRDWAVKARNVKDVFADVSALSNGNAWAVGRNGTVMKSSSNGQKWEIWNLQWDFSKLKPFAPTLP
jgi:photosystem II stability/assembly factor-like uncharacterized protein